MAYQIPGTKLISDMPQTDSGCKTKFAQRRKWIRHQVPRIKAAVVKYRAIPYFQDESNISLTAVLAQNRGTHGRYAPSACHGQ
jgi:hypothetical protein